MLIGHQESSSSPLAICSSSEVLTFVLRNDLGDRRGERLHKTSHLLDGIVEECLPFNIFNVALGHGTPVNKPLFLIEGETDWPPGSFMNE